jgi:hypothetical protein
MVKKAEIEKQKEMNKALKEIDNKWEALAFVWAYRRKEFLAILAILEFAIIIVLLGKYTTAFQTIGKWVLSLFGGK